MYRLFFALTIVMGASFAHGQIIISEIMYDVVGTDAGYEWIEVHNTSSDSIDIASWKFLENDVNHSLSLELGVSSHIPAGEYAVIASDSAKFINTHPAYGGVLFDSVFSLNNQGESLSLVNDEAVIDTVVYTPQDSANGTGHSLQYLGGVWQGSAPTPGQQNNISSNPSGLGQIDSDNNETASEKTKSKEDIIDPYYTASLNISVPKIIVGVSSEFDLSMVYHRSRISNVQKHSGRFVWSMGDGYSFEQDWEEPVKYTYHNPGTYIIHIEYFSNNLEDEPAFFIQTPVVVHAADIKIISIDDDGATVIQNNLPFMFDLSRWGMEHGEYQYMFPQHTYIAAQQSLAIQTDVHQLNTLAGQSMQPISLVFPSGQYHSRIIPNELVIQKQIKKASMPVEEETQIQSVSIENTIDLEHESTTKPIDPMVWITMGLGALTAIITLVGIIFLQRKEVGYAEISLAEDVDVEVS